MTAQPKSEVMWRFLGWAAVVLLLATPFVTIVSCA